MAELKVDMMDTWKGQYQVSLKVDWRMVVAKDSYMMDLMKDC